MALRMLKRMMITGLLLVTFEVFKITAELYFGPENPENNDVTFEGENVTLVCRVDDMAIMNESITFNINHEERSVIIDNNDVSDGRIAEFQSFGREIRFTLPSVGTRNSGSYTCDVSSNFMNTEMSIFRLTVSPPNTAQCRHNGTYTTFSTDIVKLSCYFKSSRNFVWIRTDSNGVSSDLTSDLEEVNVMKSHLVSYVQPSDNLTKFRYSCVNDSANNPQQSPSTHGCTVGSFIVYSQSLVTFSPNIKTISPGETVNISCFPAESSAASSIKFIPIWANPRPPIGTDINVTSISSSTIELSVSDSAINGINITVTCNVFLDGTVLGYPYFITVETPSVLVTPTTRDPNDSNGLKLILLLSLLTVLILLAITLLFCISRYIHFGDGKKGNQRDDKYSEDLKSPENKKESISDNNKNTTKDGGDGGIANITSGIDNHLYDVVNHSSGNRHEATDDEEHWV